MLRGANNREDEVHSSGTLNIVEYVRNFVTVIKTIVDICDQYIWIYYDCYIK